jgi:hypothetical protein
LRELSSEKFTALWSEPSLFHWVRVAFQLLDNRINKADIGKLARDYMRELGSTSTSQALIQHLDAFRIFELGSSIANGSDIHWDKPLKLSLPCALPCTGWTIRGLERVEIIAYADGCLQLQVEGERYETPLVSGRVGAASLSVLACTVSSYNGAELRIQPEVMAGLGFREARPALETTDEYRTKTARIIDQALQRIATYAPDSFRLLAEETHVIAAKAPGNEHSNSTFSSLPGAMVLSVVPHTFEMADRIIHEVHHDRLFCIEEFNALLVDGTEDSPNIERYYSPWRDDLRPVRGILHGVYVFIAVGRFWMNILKEGTAAAEDLEYAAERLRRAIGQLHIAIDVLTESANFTPFGKGVFEQLKEDVMFLERASVQTEIPKDIRSLFVDKDGDVVEQVSLVSGKKISVTESLQEHREIVEGTRSDHLEQ